MKPDISSRKDIKLIITKFYDLLLADKKMIPFFEDIVAQNHLEEHLEVISDFWNDILFDTNSYANNVMKKHVDKNVFVAFKKEHFTIWMSYFFKTIDDNFDGERAHNMKNRARSIATVMELKMNVYQ
ncbi:group III truncated hemoglobin [Polaribacter undariae]|uniref:Group III truncated hemoglobin n=1 Tax=Polaribacter sejongensis TaxID=985043 RepID=A0AAJ1QW44_9FLAO|nr:group III truncated hemoglobin [Polaribacter undariae]MDN3619170.1 group III truncated hemoglobin [Polaribacter undariae]UWD33629.1 group III truncated hemoglobin [Polaribacter undariae]